MIDDKLLHGSITKSFIKLSLPLMGTAFIQMTYSLIDLIWLGRLSTEAVAAVGVIGFFIWIVESLTLICSTGLSVSISQSLGRNDEQSAREYVKSGLYINVFLIVFMMVLYGIFMEPMLSFFNLERKVFQLSVEYFTIINAGMTFMFLNPSISAIFFARGDSYTPFKISLIALIFNIVFDPILIFGIGFFPKLGIRGAAIATVMAQLLATVIYLVVGRSNREIYATTDYRNVKLKYTLDILNLGVPAASQSLVHAGAGIVLNRFISSYGASAIAVYSIGSQIESISWMSAEGMGKAFSTFMGQNYGAKNFERIEEAEKIALRIVTILGTFTSILLFVFSDELFRFFLPDDHHTVLMGATYLKIIAPSELFMCIEIGSSGILAGLGLTKYPAIVGMVFNILRIPMAYFAMPIFSVEGIWASMSLSSILKGIFLLIILKYLRRQTDGFRENMHRYNRRYEEEIC